MRRGLSLPELLVVLTIMGTLLGITLPRLGGWLDWAAVDGAAGEVTMAIATARQKAIAWGARTQLVVREEMFTIDTLGPQGWSRWREYPGPAARRVGLTVTNARIVFAPNGIAWGASNTTIVLRRGSRSETITVSRVGRVKRW
jgi:prepilin-type N-terminal cleavage/methylation domain-containing protein